ncbi:MAG: tRNA (adenosine(37)-N6)-dimethylallyltransferase MiaA [Myxococcales bacterium]|nr:tRNA (adenosine(37)-N6)-dimethylallyltransferase MiaA [Myxococcales bacterium]
MPGQPPVVVITGPTATGKTPLAIELARAFDAEIVSADSMQVFRFMDIGTAKPTVQQRGLAPHHMLDVVNPDVPYSAGRYAEAARALAQRIHSRSRVVLLVGGTGLYIRAFLEGLIEGADVDPDLRAELEREHARALAEQDPERLYRRLQEVDPAAAERLHPNDTRRILRALEICTQLGRPASEVRREHAFSDRPFRVLHLALDLPARVLAARIDARCHAMIEGGLLQEMRELQKLGYGPELRPLQAIGYRHMAPVVAGIDTLANALPAMQRDTRHFARRQRTWLRSEPSALWVDPRKTAQIQERVSDFLGRAPAQSGTAG